MTIFFKKNVLNPMTKISFVPCDLKFVFDCKILFTNLGLDSNIKPILCHKHCLINKYFLRLISIYFKILIYNLLLSLIKEK